MSAREGSSIDITCLHPPAWGGLGVPDPLAGCRRPRSRRLFLRVANRELFRPGDRYVEAFEHQETRRGRAARWQAARSPSRHFPRSCVGKGKRAALGFGTVPAPRLPAPVKAQQLCCGVSVPSSESHSSLPRFQLTFRKMEMLEVRSQYGFERTIPSVWAQPGTPPCWAQMVLPALPCSLE